MAKKNIKNFQQISNRLKTALDEFQSIKKSEKFNNSNLIDQEKAQKALIKNIKSLINDLS